MPKNSLASQFNGNKPECVTSLDDNHEAVIETPYGFLEGLNYTVGTPLKPFHTKVFLGVAYAYNAIGEFRFRRPITVPSFSLASTKRYARHCFPNKNYHGVKDFNEDCLFLNIFMPNDESVPANGFPVLFFIHGGMFNYGASDDMDLTSIVKNYVRRGITVVTANYRLGPFGFFQSRARHFSYNIGLWDLEKAFEFIVVSAEKLGLDRNKITLGGVEGGAVMAELLSLRDEVRSNISGLILVGGSILSPWAISPGVFDASMKLAKELGINNTTDPRDVIYGIKMAYASSLIEIREKTRELSQDSRDFIEFTPDFDYEFFYYSTLKRTFYEAREIDVLIITTRNEGSIRTSTWKQGYYGVFNEKTGVRLEKQSTYSCKNFEGFVQKHFNQSQANEILAEYKCASSSSTTVTPFEIYKNFIGDFWFNIPAALSALLYAELENNVYVAVVNTSDAGYEKFTGQKEMPSIIMNEAYLFSHTNPYNLDKTNAENALYKATQNLLLDTVTNFVKKDHTKLQKVNADAYQNLKFGYLDIANGNAKIETNKILNEKLPFWRNFLRKYGFNLLNPRLDDGQDLFYFEDF